MIKCLQEDFPGETRHANVKKNLRAALIYFIPDPVFWIMRV